MTGKLENLSIARYLTGWRAGDFRASELIAYYREKIARANDQLNVYLEVFDNAAEQAAEADERLARGESPRALEGVPLALKDNILVEGQRASAASRGLENYVAAYDATVVSRLRAAGAIILGRTNMDEFAMGSSTENSAFGPTHNPIAPERVPGGSSGGSAAAVAADLALAALGSDTGGSIRQPAAFCGVVGLKPTYGAVSRYGLIALASSLDQIGPLARTVEDAKLLFDVIRGRDERDATTLSAANQPSAVSPTTRKGRKIKLGVLADELIDGLSPSIANSFRREIERLRIAGYALTEISLPSLYQALAAYYIIVPAEASSNLARYDGFRYGLHRSGADLYDDYCLTRAAGFGLEVRRRIIIGTYALSSGYYDTYYGRAVAVKERLTEEFVAVFRQVDAIITPTTPTAAFKLGEHSADPLQMYLSDMFTVPANLAGLPALTVPIQPEESSLNSSLPLGLQFIAPPFQEDLLFKLGQDHENF